VKRFEQVLQLDPENLTAHYNLALLQVQLEDTDRAIAHLAEHEKYRPTTTRGTGRSASSVAGTRRPIMRRKPS